MRDSKPFIMTSIKEGKGIDEIVAMIEHEGLLAV